jgi:glycosyltransferase 2 family protein
MELDTDAPAPPAEEARFGWIGIVKFAVTATLLGVLLVRTPVSEVMARVAAVGPASLALATGLLLLVVLAIGVRWRLVLRQFGAEAGITPAMRYTLIGGFFNQVLPSGMGGDVFRVWYARRFGLSTGRAFATVVVDRLFGLFAIAVIVTAGVPFVLWMDAPAALIAAAAIAVALLACAIVLFLWLDAWERPAESIARRLVPERFHASVQRMVAGAAWSARSSRAMLRAWPQGAIAIVISIGCQLLVGFVVFLLLRSMGQSVALVTVLFLFPFVQLLSMLPISFAGWGLREGAMVVAFRLVGVPAEAALGASILFGLCLLASSLPGVPLWLGERRHAPAPAK